MIPSALSVEIAPYVEIDGPLGDSDGPKDPGSKKRYTIFCTFFLSKNTIFCTFHFSLNKLLNEKYIINV